MVPPSKYAAYSGASVGVVSVANVLGPVVGGLININGSWRWAFLFMWVAPGQPELVANHLLQYPLWLYRHRPHDDCLPGETSKPKRSVSLWVVEMGESRPT